MLVGGSRDTRLLVVYGYARLVGYDLEFNLVPDILKAVEVEDGRGFTMHLREGHRWSDGAPFTTEDFRYWWEDVATNEQLSPIGPPLELQSTVNRRRSRSWTSAPCAIRGPSPTRSSCRRSPAAGRCSSTRRPTTSSSSTSAMPIRTSSPGWSRMTGRATGRSCTAGATTCTASTTPICRPCSLGSCEPSARDRFVAVRNPYYHRVDQRGQQLPYIDRVMLEVVDTADPGQDRRRRDRPAGARPGLQGLHLPQGERGSQRSAHAAVADRARRPPRALSEPERRRPGLAGAVPRRPFPPRAVARHQPRRHQSDLLLRPRDRRQQHGPAGEARCTSRSTASSGPSTIRARQPAARPDRPAAMRAASASCPTAGRWI